MVIFSMMKFFILVLLLTSYGIDKSLADTCVQGLVSAFTASIVTEVPVVSTIANIFNTVIGLTCPSSPDATRNIAMEEDRRTEVEEIAGALRGYRNVFREINSYNDVAKKYGDLNNQRRGMTVDRHTFFDGERRYHEGKFELFAEWATVDLMIHSILIGGTKDRKQRETIEESYGRALIYYIAVGSKMFSKYPITLAHNGDGKRAEDAARLAAINLRPTLVQWIEAVEEKDEIRNRVFLAHQQWWKWPNPTDDHNQWNIAELGEIERQYLPLKISDGDWISIKIAGQTVRQKGNPSECYNEYTRKKNRGCTTITKTYGGKNTWLSCAKSVSDSDWCRTDRTCPGLAGNQGNNQCRGERFQIQSTTTGAITLSDHVGFKYRNNVCNNDRSEGHYWLSTAESSSKYYTMPCPGSTFTKSDLSRCDKEKFLLSSNGEGILRNGDFIWMKGLPSGFIMKQFFQEGDIHDVGLLCAFSLS